MESNTNSAEFRFSVGGTRVTVISDGYAYLPAEMFGGGVGLPRIQQILEQNDLPLDRVRLSLNPLVLERDDRLVVVDPGPGQSDGTTMGRFLTNFGRAGFEVADVDLVLVSHGHPDHWGALLTGGELTFPNARVGIAEAEFTHWRDVGDFGEANVPDALADAARTVGREITAAIADRVDFLVGDEEILPGLRVIAASGHTPGHTAFLLADGGETLLIGGEFAHHEILNLEEPDSYVTVDCSSALSTASRRSLLHLAAKAGYLVHGFHFSWPGLGVVEEKAGHWRFVSGKI
jgi:glyoxylase-like metal-dependent hydrolase (beta-lactamase superfamily II)